MSRRVAKPLVPLLVALVALVLGFLAMGTSFADEPAVSPAPTVTQNAPSPVKPGKGGPEVSQPKHDEPTTGAPGAPQQGTTPPQTDPHGCSSCLGHDDD